MSILECKHCPTPVGKDAPMGLCTVCLEKYEDGMAQARELLADTPSDWFDPAAAGEVWHEDDY
jgi:hypothetical protein